MKTFTLLLKKILILFFIVGILLHIGCIKSKDRYTKEGEFPGIEAGRLVINYWEKWTDFEGEAMQRVVDEFNDTSGIGREKKIFVNMLAVSQIDRKLLVATAGGNPPDIAGVWTFTIYQYADKGALTPLNNFVKGTFINKEHYIPKYWDLCHWRGELYGLPSTPATIGLYWNKRLFREAGLDPDKPPKTIAELDEMAEKMTLIKFSDGTIKSYFELKNQPEYKNNHNELLKKIQTGKYIQLGFLPSEPGWWPWSWVYWFGGSILDKDYNFIANSPENIKAQEWVQSYAKKYGYDMIINFTTGFGQFSSPQNPFLSGKIGMEVQGVWMYNFIDKFAHGMEWSAAPFPYVDGSKVVSYTEADLLVIPNGAPHAKEAFEFIKFTQTQKAMEMLCLGQRKYSPLKEVSDDFYISHPHPKIRVFRAMAESPNTFITPPTPLWQKYQRDFSFANDKINRVTSSPKEALDFLQKEIQPSLERYRKRMSKIKARSIKE